MHRLIAAVCIAGVLWVAPEAAADKTSSPQPAVKQRYFDSFRALNEVDEGKVAIDKLKREMEAEEKKLARMREAVKAKAEAFDKQSAMMKPEARDARQKELQQEVDELQKAFVETRENLAKNESTVTEEINRKLRAVIAKIGDREGYTAVLDINHGVVYFKRHEDITDDVIVAYNRQYGKK